MHEKKAQKSRDTASLKREKVEPVSLSPQLLSSWVTHKFDIKQLFEQPKKTKHYGLPAKNKNILFDVSYWSRIFGS